MLLFTLQNLMKWEKMTRKLYFFLILQLNHDEISIFASGKDLLSAFIKPVEDIYIAFTRDLFLVRGPCPAYNINFIANMARKISERSVFPISKFLGSFQH